MCCLCTAMEARQVAVATVRAVRSAALRSMIDLICARTGIDRYQAHTLCSLAADLRVTQVVNGNKGIHVMLEKKFLERTVA